MSTTRFFSIVALFFIIITSVAAEESSSPVKIEEILIDAVLHEDSSISYSQMNGISLPLEDLIFPEKVVMIYEIQLPQGSELSPHIQVTELISGKEFTQTYSLDSNCSDKFVFDRKRNVITICVTPQKQLRIKSHTTILPRQNYTTYTDSSNITEVIGNELQLIFPPTNYSYFMSVSFVGDENVRVDSADNDAYGETGKVTLNISEMKLLPKTNGRVYQGFILPSDTHLIFKLSGMGENYAKILERKQEEFNRLQREFINASISSSEASIIVSKSSKTSVVLIILLIAITAFYAGAAHKTWREMTRSNMPLISAKLDSFGVNKVVLKIVNVGKSAARNISLNYQVEPDGPQKKWKHHLLESKDFVRLIIQDKKKEGFSLKKFANSFEKIIIKSKYEDIHKKRYKNEFEIDLLDLRKAINKDTWISETTLKEDIEQISSKITELSDTFKSKTINADVKNIDLNPQKLKSEIQSYERLLQERKEALEKLREAEKQKEKDKY